MIKLKEFKKDATCVIIFENNINIKCWLKYENDEYEFCLNKNKDINIESIRYKEFNYILINENELHLYLFEKLGTHTLEAGDIIRGSCLDDKYNFKIIDSLIYNNLANENEIKFDLMLIQHNEINASCFLPPNLIMNNKFDINCIISDINDICPLDSIEDEI